MNGRILELAEQAELTKGVWVEPDSIERFAELIVMECAKVAAQTPCPYQDEFAKQTYGHTWDKACVESAKAVRKHFGV